MEKLYSYRGKEPYIFISYAHRDSGAVYPILADMQKDGYRVWFDEGIDPGTEWDETIANSIQNCGYFIAFVSKNYLASYNCKDELNYARDLDKKRLIVYLEEVTLPAGMAMRMNRIQSIFKYKYTDEADFYKTLYQTDGITAFTSGAAGSPAKSRSAAVKKATPTVKTINYKDGSVYNGEVNAAGVPHGKGMLRERIPNDYAEWYDVYEGIFENGKMVRGSVQFADDTTYEGEMLDGKFHGRGVWVFKSICGGRDIRYEGEFRNDRRNGYGVYSDSKGDVYEGEWRDSKKNGNFIVRTADGKVSRVVYKDDKPVT